MKSILIGKNHDVNKEKMNLWGEFCIMENNILQLDEKFVEKGFTKKNNEMEFFL